MLTLDTIAIFIAASVALSLSPGPDNIFVLTQSAMYGRKAGVLITLGLCTGLLFHTAAVALGVAAIFQTSIFAFTLLKVIGALYLLYLAWQAFNAKATTINNDSDAKNTSQLKVKQLYRRGILMNVTNPKVAIFFLAFLPQFTHISQGSITLQMISLGGLFILSALVVFSSIAWSAGSLGEKLRESDRIQQWINKLAAIVFISLAIKLLMTER